MEYKGYLIKPAKGASRCYTIATEGRGGKIPDCMQGFFTSTGVAISVIDAYLDLKAKNVKPDDKESSKGGS
jgi:hypothetical protein